MTLPSSGRLAITDLVDEVGLNQSSYRLSDFRSPFEMPSGRLALSDFYGRKFVTEIVKTLSQSEYVSQHASKKPLNIARDMFGSPTEVGDYVFINNATILGLSPGGDAVVTGVLPAGSTLTIINNGRMVGAGGRGGIPGVGSGVGSPGGDSLVLQMNIILEKDGIMRAGGGGGAIQGELIRQLYYEEDPNNPDEYVGKGVERHGTYSTKDFYQAAGGGGGGSYDTAVGPGGTNNRSHEPIINQNTHKETYFLNRYINAYKGWTRNPAAGNGSLGGAGGSVEGAYQIEAEPNSDSTEYLIESQPRYTGGSGGSAYSSGGSGYLRVISGGGYFTEMISETAKAGGAGGVAIRTNGYSTT